MPCFMEKEQTAAYKSENSAVRVIKLYKILCGREKGYDLFRQMLRSGTSIGANVAEVECAISKKDFLSKKPHSTKRMSRNAVLAKTLV